MKYLLIAILFIIPVKLKDEVRLDVDSIRDNEIVLTEELKCLADNVYHESKGESLRGKQAVAQVTLNRVNNEKFPSDVCEVVYERSKKVCQFSWTCKNINITYDDAYEDSLMIAYAVLENEVYDHRLSKSLFFHANYVKPKWKKKPITKIGKHIFYE